MEERSDPEERDGFLRIRKGTNKCAKYVKVYKTKLLVVLVVCVFATAIGIVLATVGFSGKSETEQDKNGSNSTSSTTTTTPDPNIKIPTTAIPSSTTIATTSVRNVTARAAINISTNPTTSVTITESGNPVGEIAVETGTQSSFQVDANEKANENDPGASSSFQNTTMIPQQLPTRPKKKISVYSEQNFGGASATFELTEKCYRLSRNWQYRISSVNTYGECFQLCTDDHCIYCERVAPGTLGHDRLGIIEGLDKRTKSMRKCPVNG